MMKRWMAALAAMLGLTLCVATSVQAADLENTLYLDLAYGRVVIEMRPDLAPNHVKRIKELVRQHFYDGVPFHRVIAGFMAQTGDPTGTGTGGSGQNIKAEFSSEHHVRSEVKLRNVAMQRRQLFFICFANADFLDGKYTIWGKVVSGMEFVDDPRGRRPITRRSEASATRS
jgi:peptidylprolyl isomerase